MEGGQKRERWSYDVFFSFRGEDVRKNVLSYLYQSLVRSGIYTFKDDDGLERGENISSELLKAIENSKIHLVVLSKNYASSSWCLDELVHIMQCRESGSGQIVVPIFYDVNPSDVRRLKGSFAESFDKLKSRYPKRKLQKWKEALANVANLAGFVADNWSVCYTPLCCPLYLKCFSF